MGADQRRGGCGRGKAHQCIAGTRFAWSRIQTWHALTRCIDCLRGNAPSPYATRSAMNGFAKTRDNISAEEASSIVWAGIFRPSKYVIVSSQRRHKTENARHGR
jgi:hypothetical protein